MTRKREPFERTKEWRDYVKHVRTELIPMIDSTALAMSLHTDDRADVKQATELGYILLLGKPLMLLVTPGTLVPRGLAKAADEIVMISAEPSDPAVLAAIQEATDRMRERGLLT